MGRYTGPVCRLCRREQVKLFLKGSKCFGGKCPVDKRTFPPGQHGQGRVKLSDYGIQLREKQKAKRIYGVYERQFRGYFQNAQKTKGVTGQMLLQQLERRIDTVLYRMGLAASRAEGRILVRHRGIAVNGRRVTIPSYLVKINDVIEPAKGAVKWAARMKQTRETTKDRPVPAWVEVNETEPKGKILRLPEKDDIGFPIQEQLIVELYSK